MGRGDKAGGGAAAGVAGRAVPVDRAQASARRRPRYGRGSRDLLGDGEGTYSWDERGELVASDALFCRVLFFWWLWRLCWPQHQPFSAQGEVYGRQQYHHVIPP